MSANQSRNGLKLVIYLVGGVVTGMIASQFIFMVIEGIKRVSRDFHFRSFISGVDDVWRVTFLFLIGAAISSFLAIPIGYMTAWNSWSSDEKKQHLALRRAYLSAGIISFIVVSLYFLEAIEKLKSI